MDAFASNGNRVAGALLPVTAAITAVQFAIGRILQ